MFIFQFHDLMMTNETHHTANPEPQQQQMFEKIHLDVYLHGTAGIH